MKKQDFYYIMAFDTTTDAMQAEAYAKDRIPSTIMPVPREISSGCGWRFVLWRQMNRASLHSARMPR